MKFAQILESILMLYSNRQSVEKLKRKMEKPNQKQPNEKSN